MLFDGAVFLFRMPARKLRLRYYQKSDRLRYRHMIAYDIQ